MNESLLQNMSAPPRSKIVVAPNKIQLTYWELSLPQLPEASSNFEEELVKQFGFKTPQELIGAVHQTLSTYPLPPIAMITSKASESKVHPDPLLVLGILARSTGNLYMARRPIRLEPILLKKTIFIPTNLLNSESL